MERMYSLPSPAPDSPDDLEKVEVTAADDITLRPFSTYPAGDAGPKLVQSWRSLPSLLDQGKFMNKQLHHCLQCDNNSYHTPSYHMGKLHWRKQEWENNFYITDSYTMIMWEYKI